MSRLRHPRSTCSAQILCAAAVLLLIGLLGPATAAAISFKGSPKSFAVESDPRSVAIGDLNGDGVPDLAVANFGSGTVSVLLGDGTDSFSGQHAFAANTEPVSVAIGDLNGDGNQDLAVANFGSDTVSVLLGDGTGSFGAPTAFATGTEPTSVAIGDLNGDGNQDLSVANLGSDSVSVLLGDGTGSFGAPMGFSTGAAPHSVAIGDLDGDGKQDLVVANFDSDSVSILLGEGDGSFESQRSVAVGQDPASAAIGDLNGDGVPDLAVADFGSKGVVSLLGMGDGSFGAPHGSFKAGNSPYAVAIGNLNGDDKPDLAVATYFVTVAAVLAGTGNGDFSPPVRGGNGETSESVAIGDLDGDGYEEVVAVDPEGRAVDVFGVKAATTLLPAGVSPVVAVVGDRISDTATLGGGVSLGGEIAFTAWGPKDPTCTGELRSFTGAVTVDGDGDYTLSPPFVPTKPGVYRFTASYSGDANNEKATTACNAPGESVVVDKAIPTLSTQASPSVPFGGRISDAATLTGGYLPSGAVVLRAFGPEDPTCALPPAYTSAPITVDGDGVYTSRPAFAPASPGTYRFKVSYAGDERNEAVTSGCNAPGESVTVTKATTTLALEAGPNPAPFGAGVTLTATVTGAAPTGTVNFSDGSTLLGTAALRSDGTASITTGALGAGTHQLSAAYAGDATNLPSSSAAFTETIVGLAPVGPFPVAPSPGAGPAAPRPPAPSPVPRPKVSYTHSHPKSLNPAGGFRYTFRLSAHLEGPSFHCRLDEKPFRPCHSPVTYRHLVRGRHVFAAKVVDTAGIESPTKTVHFFAGRRR